MNDHRQESGCYCPSDCACHNPHRQTVCGCTGAHDATPKTKRDRALALMVTVSQDWDTLTDCVAWMDSADRRCAREVETGWLCKRHVTVAERKLAKAIERDAAEKAKRAAARAGKLPGWRAELAEVEAEMARRDPAPPTTDRAAYGGVGCSTTARYQKRIFRDSNVEAMGRLVRRAEELRSLIG